MSKHIVHTTMGTFTVNDAEIVEVQEGMVAFKSKDAGLMLMVNERNFICVELIRDGANT